MTWRTITNYRKMFKIENLVVNKVYKISDFSKFVFEKPIIVPFLKKFEHNLSDVCIIESIPIELWENDNVCSFNFSSDLKYDVSIIDNNSFKITAHGSSSLIMDSLKFDVFVFEGV